MDHMATDDRLHTEIARILRDAKQTTKLSFADLSERSGFAQSAIVNWLNGTRSPQVESFYYLCKALSLDAPEVLREAIANIERSEELHRALSAAVQEALRSGQRTFIVDLPNGTSEQVTVEIRTSGEDQHGSDSETHWVKVGGVLDLEDEAGDSLRQPVAAGRAAKPVQAD